MTSFLYFQKYFVAFKGVIDPLSVWHYVGGPQSRRFLCLFWRETRQRVWTRDLDATGSRKETPVGVGQRNSVKSVGDGRRRVADEVDTGQQRDQSEEIGSGRNEGRPFKMSQHSSWVVEFSLEIHASVSLHMHRECNVT